MTRDEAQEAGALVRALQEHERASDELRDAMQKNPGELIGVSLSNELSEAGASGLGLDVVVPADIALAAWGHLEVLIRARLTALGVH